MSDVAVAMKRSRIAFLRSRTFWVSTLVTLFGVAGAMLLFEWIIEGRCDTYCMSGIFAQSLRYATPIAFAAMCGVMCERAGVIDIGIEGKMLVAAMVGYAVNLFLFQTLKTSMDPQTAGNISRWVALVAAVISAFLTQIIHALLSIKYKANQVISGTVINILALGITGYLYRQYLAQNLPAGPGTFPLIRIPLLSEIPVIGRILFIQQPLTYIMLILTVVITYVLFATPWGLRTRAVGEHPRAADTLGINVFKVRYINVLVGGMIAGLGGAWFTLESADVFNPGMTTGLGFIGLAAMIFGKWNPLGALLGALIFGFGSSITTKISFFRPDIPSYFPQMLPYILTIIVLTGVVGRAIPPAADGEPYEKQ